MRRDLCAGSLLLIVSSFACATSWHDDSHYVSLGPRTGYYIVRLDSRLLRQLGLYEAPVIDTADPLRHGYGADALAFRFNRNGVLIAPPAYIAQASANDFYLRRIGSLTRDRAKRGISFWPRPQPRRSPRRFYLVLRPAGSQSVRGVGRPPLRRAHWTIAL
jgi:hypothetical protein